MDAFEMMKFEQAHTELLRNCKSVEISGLCRVAYVVCRIDDEYGYNVLSDVFFTMDDAFRYACKRASELQGENYCDFLLVEDARSLFGYDYQEREDWEYTEICIYEYNQAGEYRTCDSTTLFAKVKRDKSA